MKNYPNKMLKPKEDKQAICDCGYTELPHSHPKISTKQSRKNIKKTVK